jgi:hypothetical protein
VSVCLFAPLSKFFFLPVLGQIMYCANFVSQTVELIEVKSGILGLHFYMFSEVNFRMYWPSVTCAVCGTKFYPSRN